MDQLNERKAVIRSILLASGNQATEKSFRYDYYSQEGESFNRVLFECKKSFYEFMRSIPDVVRVWDSGDGLVLQRVSTEQSSHMDNLTVITTKKVRKSIPFRFRLAKVVHKSCQIFHNFIYLGPTMEAIVVLQQD